jgi:hypothetical protein
MDGARPAPTRPTVWAKGLNIPGCDSPPTADWWGPGCTIDVCRGNIDVDTWSTLSLHISIMPRKRDTNVGGSHGAAPAAVSTPTATPTTVHKAVPTAAPTAMHNPRPRPRPREAKHDIPGRIDAYSGCLFVRARTHARTTRTRFPGWVVHVASGEDTEW